MSDSGRFEPSGPTLNLSQSQGHQRQQDVLLGRNERSGYDEDGRRSPRGDSRGWNKWDGGRGPHGDSSRPGAETNGRYGEFNGRYGPGPYRGGYANQGNRRFSLNDRPNGDQRYNDNHNFGRRTDYGYDHPDQRRGPNVYNTRGSYDRRVEEPSPAKSPQATTQTLQVEPVGEHKPDEETRSPVKEVVENVEAGTLDVPLAADMKEEPTNGTDSPVSLGPWITAIDYGFYPPSYSPPQIGQRRL